MTLPFLHVVWNCFQINFFDNFFQSPRNRKEFKRIREKYVPKKAIFKNPKVEPSFKTKDLRKENYLLIIPCPNQVILRVKVYISVDFLLISDIIKVLTKDVITIWRI